MTKGLELETPVCFVCDDPGRWGDVLDGALPDPNEEPHRYKWGRDAWIVMTYLYLRRVGYPAQISRKPNKETVNIVHYNDVGARMIVDGHYIVCTRADKPPTNLTPWRVVVNPAAVESRRDVAMPHWPQPGLVPRDLSRGDRIRTAGYLGHGPELHPSFYSAKFHRPLREMGIEWRQPVDHHDFSDIDVVVAVRSGDADWKRNKPASKLVNAWLAGVPAIVSDESAYAGLRKGPLDYLSAENAEETLTCLRRLREEPDLCRQMSENGFQRKGEFTVGAIVQRWADFFDEMVIPDFLRWKGSANAHSRVLRLAVTVSQLPGHRRRKKVLEDYIGSRNFDHHLRLAALLDSVEEPVEIGDSLL